MPSLDVLTRVTGTKKSPKEKAMKQIVSKRTRGFLQALIGTLAVTPDATLLRLAEAEGAPLWVATSIKLLFIGLFCALHPLSTGARNVVNSMHLGPTHCVLAAAGQGLINLGYSLAFLTTTVSEALMLIMLHPLWGAIGGRIFLKEQIPRHTVAALVSSLIAVLVIFVPPIVLDDGASGLRSSFHGNLIALLTGVTLAGTILVNRHAGMHRPEELGPALELAAGAGSFILGLITLPLACAEAPVLLANATNATTPLPLAAESSGSCAGFGALRLPFWPLIATDALCIAVCTVLSTVYAPRHIFAAEVGLVLLGEQILSPVWAYIGVGEAPATWTLGGGALLIVTLAAHELAALRQERLETSNAASTTTLEKDSSAI